MYLHKVGSSLALLGLRLALRQAFYFSFQKDFLHLLISITLRIVV